MFYIHHIYSLNDCATAKYFPLISFTYLTKQFEIHVL